MSERVLVAGIGNVFLRDDGFGVSVVRQLADHDFPPSVVVRDVGIRGLHLAYELIDGWDLLVAVDAVERGASPGTLHVIEPASESDAEQRCAARAPDAHGMDLASILAAACSLGAPRPEVLIVGCDVADLSEGIGLTPEVEAAVPGAARLVASIVRARVQRSSPVVTTFMKEVGP